MVLYAKSDFIKNDQRNFNGCIKWYKFYVQYERLCCIGYTNWNRRREVVLYVRYNTDTNIVKYILVIRMDVNVRIRKKSWR